MLNGWRRKTVVALILWTGAITGWVMFRKEPFDPSNHIQGLWIGYLVATSVVALALTLAALWQATQLQSRLPAILRSPAVSAAWHVVLLFQVAGSFYLYFRVEHPGTIALCSAIASAALELINILDSVAERRRNRQAGGQQRA